MIYTIINDLHIYAPNQILSTAAFNPHNPYEIYNGDNIDMANCKKSEVTNAQNTLNYYKKAYGDRFISGNHERQGDSDRIFHIPNTNIGISHGDYIFWGKQKSDEYRAKKHGAGFLKRGLWVNTLEALENGYDRKVSDEDLERFYQLCIRKGLDRIVVGHMHPKARLEINYKSKRLTVLPRGKNLLEI